MSDVIQSFFQRFGHQREQRKNQRSEISDSTFFSKFVRFHFSWKSMQAAQREKSNCAVPNLWAYTSKKNQRSEKSTLRCSKIVHIYVNEKSAQKKLCTCPDGLRCALSANRRYSLPAWGVLSITLVYCGCTCNSNEIWRFFVNIYISELLVPFVHQSQSLK